MLGLVCGDDGEVVWGAIEGQVRWDVLHEVEARYRTLHEVARSRR